MRSWYAVSLQTVEACVGGAWSNLEFSQARTLRPRGEFRAFALYVTASRHPSQKSHH